ncbi:hypothetical protein [Streptomyces sp. NPDC057580]
MPGSWLRIIRPDRHHEAVDDARELTEDEVNDLLDSDERDAG